MTPVEFQNALAELRDAIHEFRIEAKSLTEDQARKFFETMNAGINVVGGIIAGHRHE